MGRINQRLNGLNPLAYLGENAYQPPEFVTSNRAPTINDAQNFELGTLWLDRGTNTPPTAEDVYILVSLDGSRATWVNFAGGTTAMETLTGNSGGAVGGDANDNINVVGDTTTITIVGNPGTNTLTVSAVGTGVVSSITGNSGGAVFPTANNTNLLGTGVITVVGNPGTSTLTITPSGAIASSFPTDSGTATPALGVLTIRTNNAALGSGSSVLFSGSGSTVTLSVTDASSNTIIGNNAGNLTLTATNSTGLGKTVLRALTSGVSNTVVGSLSGALITSGANNSILGEGSGTALLTGNNNIMIGQATGTAYTGAESGNTLIGHTGIVGSSNQIIISLGSGGNRWIHNVGGTFVGNLTGNLAYAGSGGMTGIGENSLDAVTTANDCTAVGQRSGTMITTGSGNTIIGKDSGGLITTGQNNTLLGLSAGYNGAAGLVTGSMNIIIGQNAGSGYTAAESDNIIIGSGNAGVTGETRTIRVGFGTTTNNRCFIDGIRGITTGIADAIAVLIDSAGQLGTTSSSLRYKENIVDIADSSSSILNLRPVKFDYRDQESSKPNYGLIAEEVAEEFPDIVVYNAEGQPETVQYHILPTLLLNELQKLSNRVLELESKLSNCCKE